MIKLAWWKHIIICGVGLVITSVIGLVVSPGSYLWFPGIFFVAWFGFFMLSYGIDRLKNWKRFRKKFVKTLNQSQAIETIKEYCKERDYILPKIPPKHGAWAASYVAGKHNTPFVVWKTIINMSKKYACWVFLICNTTNGDVSDRGISAEFTTYDLEEELEKRAGRKVYVERIQMPEQKGEVRIRTPYREEVEE